MSLRIPVAPKAVTSSVNAMTITMAEPDLDRRFRRTLFGFIDRHLLALAFDLDGFCRIDRIEHLNSLSTP